MKCHKLPGGGFDCESGDWIPVISNGSKAISPYDAGHEHGVSDAKMENINPASRSLYIVQLGKNLYDHTQNFTWDYIAGYCSLQPCPEKDSSSTTTPHPGLNPNSFNAGIRYGFNDWNIHVPGGKWEMSQSIGSKPYAFECPLAHTAPHSNFCNGYDAALVYENSDY